jgi:hypothetical protein
MKSNSVFAQGVDSRPLLINAITADQGTSTSSSSVSSVSSSISSKSIRGFTPAGGFTTGKGNSSKHSDNNIGLTSNIGVSLHNNDQGNILALTHTNKQTNNCYNAINYVMFSNVMLNENQSHAYSYSYSYLYSYSYSYSYS